MCISQVRSPAQIHLTEQLVVCSFLDEVVDVSLYGQRQTQHFIPALYHALQTLLDVTHMSFSLGRRRKNDKTIQ